MGIEESAGQAIARAFEYLERVQTLDTTSEKVTASALGYGWWAHVVRTAEAIRRLTEEGFGHEAGPLRRSVLDHSLSLMWLAENSEEAVAAYLWHHADKQNRIRKRAQEEGWELVSTIPVAPMPDPKPPLVSLVRSLDELSKHLGFGSAYLSAVKHLCRFAYAELCRPVQGWAQVHHLPPAFSR